MAPLERSESDHDLLLVCAQGIETIKEDVKEMKAKATSTEERVAVLWADRSIWNWVLRIVVIATPVVAILANVYTAK